MLVYIDESGDLGNFETGSKYFLVTAVVMADSQPVNDLHELRHAIDHDGFALPEGFHAKNDPHPRRMRVLKTLAQSHFEIHSVALEKSKMYHALRESESRAYGTGVKILVNFLLGYKHRDNDVSLVFATYGDGKIKRELQASIRTSVARWKKGRQLRIAFWDSNTHAGLQIADYASWVIQRRLELNDGKSQEAVATLKSKIGTVFDPFNSKHLTSII